MTEKIFYTIAIVICDIMLYRLVTKPGKASLLGVIFSVSFLLIIFIMSFKNEIYHRKHDILLVYNLVGLPLMLAFFKYTRPLFLRGYGFFFGPESWLVKTIGRFLAVMPQVVLVMFVGIHLILIWDTTSFDKQASEFENEFYGIHSTDGEQNYNRTEVL